MHNNYHQGADCISGLKKFIIHQMDIETTFLNEDLTKDIYMKRPRGLDTPIHKVYRLTKFYMVLSRLQNSSMRNLTGLFVAMGIESVNLTSTLYKSC